jgi:putative ABC transport system permease protein
MWSSWIGGIVEVNGNPKAFNPNFLSMIFNYIKMAIRSLIRERVYSIINIGGLALGISVSVLLFLWALDELSFDKFHSKAENIFRINANFNRSGMVTAWSVTPGPVAYHAKKELPLVAEAVRVAEDNGQVVFTVNNQNFVETRIAYVDESFFRVFDYELKKGNKEKPFPDLKSIIISDAIAKKFFGHNDPIGQTVRFEDKEDFVVSGVMKNMPQNSTLQLDILFPFGILIHDFQANEYWKSLESDWGNYNYFTYLQLQDGADPNAVATSLTSIHLSHHSGDNIVGVKYTLQPIETIHLLNADLSDAGEKTVVLFTIIGFAILGIACINYINLATARATRRAKEVGIRKTVGANRGKLIWQFLIESGCISVLSLVLALVVIQLSIPYYNELSGKSLDFNLLGLNNVALLSLVLVVVWFVAGAYPAYVLSSFRPMEILRGKNFGTGGNSLFRKILVTSQFGLSIAIIVGTLVVQRQLNFIQEKKLGYSKENVFTFGFRGEEMFKHKQAILNSLQQHPGIEHVTMAGQNVIRIGSTTGDTKWEGQPTGQTLMVHPMNVQADFMKVMKMELAAGRGFLDSKGDTASYILNEAAIREMGITDPIGKQFSLWERPGTIVGIIKNFHHNSLKSKIEPTILYNRPDWLWMVYVKINGKDTKGAVARAEEIWKQYNPKYPFDYSFMDIAFDNMYKSEVRTEKLFAIFSLVAIVVSCLGLFGLSTFTATQRTKEIGVRKILGATVTQIVVLLSKDFIKLILLAIVVAAPVSFFLMRNWLQSFAYRIDIEWTIFGIAGLLALTIAMLTIAIHTTKAAAQNPVDSLRSE